MSGAEVVLRHGTTFLQVDEIPGLLALALHPERPFVRTLRSLQKVTVHEGAEPESMTHSDELKLAELFVGLPALFLGVTEAEWNLYAAAFLAAENRPDWTPFPVWVDLGMLALALRADAENRHKTFLFDAVARGGVAVDHARIPTTEPCGAIVMLTSFTAYAKQFGVTVRVDADPSSTPPESGTGKKPIQRLPIQEEEIIAMLKTLGYDPLKLPKPRTGTVGVKSKIRNAVGTKGIWAGSTVFDKAWERLARNADISYLA